MTVKVNYGRLYYEDHEDEDPQSREGQVEDAPWYRLADPGYDPEEEEGYLEEGLEDFQEGAEVFRDATAFLPSLPPIFGG